MYLSGNLVNSLSDYLDTSKEFIKAYPIDKIADVQTGYILKRNQDIQTSQNIISLKMGQDLN